VLKLKNEGNARWLLTYVLGHVEAKDVRAQIADAFPETWSEGMLPQAESSVTSALDCLKELLSDPLPEPLLYQLLPKKSRFDEIAQRIVTLFAYKSLHESLFKLLFSLSVAESLLADQDDHLPPNLEGIAGQMDEIVGHAPETLKLLGADAAPEKEWIDKLPALAASLRGAGNAPDKAADVIDQIQRLVRQNLSGLNGDIFAAANKLSFDPWRYELPADIRDKPKFLELDQAIRDLTATIRARAFKHKMWQEAENTISLIGTAFDSPSAVRGIIRDWLPLRASVDWLAALEKKEKWADEAKKFASDMEHELYKEAETADVKDRFDAYRGWFRGPFQKIDDTLKMDCGAIYRMDDRFSGISNALGKILGEANDR
jgi:hypothetical protein